MPGETNLSQLLKAMQPALDPVLYVFVTKTENTFPTTKEIIGCFREDEGLTFIVEKDYADAQGWSYQSIWKRIIMTVHSSLEAVGFLAALSRQLADQGISVNAISAYYHDHLFVPAERAEEAMRVLNQIK